MLKKFLNVILVTIIQQYINRLNYGQIEFTLRIQGCIDNRNQAIQSRKINI